MLAQEMISLECPHCQKEMYQPLTWFKEPNFTCTVCGQGLTAGQFATTIKALEEALEESYAERINGKASSACCCGGGKGGKGHCSGE